MSPMTRQLHVLDNDDGTLLKVAFATGDRSTVDQHFGSARSFVIYGVNPDQAKLLSVSEFGELAQDGNEDKLASKIQMLDGCIAVYCLACGASAVRQLMAQGIQPIKVPEITEITLLIIALQDELRSGPSAWLAKAIARVSPPQVQRFDEMESEGWSE